MENIFYYVWVELVMQHLEQKETLENTFPDHFGVSMRVLTCTEKVKT